MMLYGNEPDFPVDAIGTCVTCKRDDVELRTAHNGLRVCADLARCAMAVIGVPEEILRAEIPEREAWVL